MSLIIKDKFPLFKVGYPTVSDKYNVLGGIFVSNDDTVAVKFGDLVKFSGTTGYYEKATGLTAASDVAGFVVATNVKLANEYPGVSVEVKPGEAFNLLLDGFIAAKLDSSAVADDVKPNAQVYVTVNGALTTAEQTNIALPNYRFTGQKENQDSAIVAEIYVK